ncbi:MAG TPA: helix-turn-helix domain-containing protein [Candidatus Baltobacteraceae bacterium]|nr:helix-turn-helix domain-containing protein [Candidatus Baltobacteraceae bacterium]
MLGEAPFVDRLIAQIRGQARIAEIPKSQRFAARPPLHRLLDAREGRDRDARHARIAAAVEAHGDTQQAIAAHLGLHFTSISRILRRVREQ